MTETGWIHIPQVPHRCIRPTVSSHPPGSIWRCNECELLWIVRTTTDSRGEAIKFLDPLSPADAENLLETGGSKSEQSPLNIKMPPSMLR